LKDGQYRSWEVEWATRFPGRAASVHDFVVRAISGHATPSMQEHYSTVSGDEVRKGLAKGVALAGIGKAPSEPNQARRRDHRGR
jgi:hypothetical protein